MARPLHGYQRELTDREVMSLLGWVEDAFPSEAARRDAWEQMRDELLTGRGGVPGSRPLAFWEYDAPGAPDPRAFDDREELDTARLGYLAERGLLDQREVDQVLAEARRTDLDASGLERCQRRLDALLDGLTAGTPTDPRRSRNG